MNDMNDLARELQELTTALDTPIDTLDMSAWKKRAEKADWILTTKNSITGTVLEYAYIFKTDLELALDVRFLRSTETLLAEETRKGILSQMSPDQNQEFNDFIVGALMPKSAGVVLSHTAVELLVPDAAGEKTKATIITEGVAELSIADGMVLCNFAHLLKPISNSGLVLCAVLDRDVFMNQVAIPASLFDTSEQFTKTYTWQQKSDVADLSIEIEATFRPR